jgi:hypothetical protein
MYSNMLESANLANCILLIDWQAINVSLYKPIVFGYHSNREMTISREENLCIGNVSMAIA